MEYVRLSHSYTYEINLLLMLIIKLNLNCVHDLMGVCVMLFDALAGTLLLALGRSVCLPSASTICIDDHG